MFKGHSVKLEKALVQSRGGRSSLKPKGEAALGLQVAALERWQLLCIVSYLSPLKLLNLRSLSCFA